MPGAPASWRSSLDGVLQPGLPSFIVFFGTLQAIHFAASGFLFGPPAAHEIGPDKTVVVLDGSGLTGDDPPTLDAMLQNPASVMTFDGDGKRKLSEEDKARLADKRKREAKEAKKRKELKESRERKEAKEAQRAKERQERQERQERHQEALGKSPLPPPPPPLPPPPSPSPPPVPVSPPPSTTMSAASAESSTSSATSSAMAAPPATAVRRPTYVWAQNSTHVFVTVSLTAEERRGPKPQVSFGSRQFQVIAPTASSRSASTAATATTAATTDGNAAEIAAEISLELYRPLRPSDCDWRMGSRGVVLRLRKRASMHWERLLRAAKHDGKQGVDWARWSHPEAEVAERHERMREQFAERNSAREREIAVLRPRFQQALDAFQAATEREEALDSANGKEMLRMGETILTHYREEREERAALLGDKPLPAGVDEEKLERALLKLQDLQRRGQLEYDRNTDSWREWRRRQKERRAKAGVADDDERLVLPPLFS